MNRACRESGMLFSWADVRPVSDDIDKADGAPLEMGQTLFEIAPLEEGMMAEISVPEEEIQHDRSRCSFSRSGPDSQCDWRRVLVGNANPQKVPTFGWFQGDPETRCGPFGVQLFPGGRLFAGSVFRAEVTRDKVGSGNCSVRQRGFVESRIRWLYRRADV